MSHLHAASGSAAEDLFIDLFSETFGAEKAGYLNNVTAGTDACQPRLVILSGIKFITLFPCFLPSCANLAAQPQGWVT